MTSTFELVLKSEFSEIEKVPDFVEELCSDSDLTKDMKERIMLAMSEAATNAIVHGNKEDINKQVSITVEVNDSDVAIEVEDEGEGFDPAEAPDPTKEENLLNPGGRGIFLMEEFADEVLYGNKGRLVTMKFHRK